jgi:hypothetical protein
MDGWEDKVEDEAEKASSCGFGRQQRHAPHLFRTPGVFIYL